MTHATGNLSRVKWQTDTAQATQGDYGQSVKHEYPMQSYNNGLRSKLNRQAPSCDADVLPHQLRHNVNASGAQDVQIWNGMRFGVLTGRRINYAGAGFLFAVVPRIPGQTRGDVAGFHKRGPSPLNIQAIWDAGPGSQPSNPGGPGTVIGVQIINPMTG